MQELINKITEFFEFKYPEEMLNRIYYQWTKKKPNFMECLKVGKYLDIEQLKYRLSVKQNRFLECSYETYTTLEKKSKEWWERSSVIIRVDSEGKVEPRDLEALEFENFLHNVEEIDTIEDLLERCMETETTSDYSKVKKLVENHKISIELRNKLLQLTMLNLLYSKNTHPKNGYIRAKRFMRMFNKEYDLDLNMKKLDDIMNIDYKNTEEVKQKIKERKKY